MPLDSDWGSKPIYDNLSFKDRSLRSFKDFLIEKMRKEYHEYCPKSKSSNIVFCPEKIIKRKKDKKVQLINDYFKNLGRKSKKKKNTKKGKKRTKKNKKTKRKKRKIKRKNKKIERKKKKTKRKRKKTKRKKRKMSTNFN